MAKKKEAGRRKLINTKVICCKLLSYNRHTIYRLLTSDGQIIRSNNVTFHETPTWQICHGIRPEQANVQDPSNDASVIYQQALTDVRKDRPMHNVELQTDGGSANRTTQLDLCEIELELSIEHDQNHHIGIPRSTPQIH